MVEIIENNITGRVVMITGASSGIGEYEMAIPADAIARAIVYAIEQPANVDINEILVRPTAQKL